MSIGASWIRTLQAKCPLGARTPSSASVESADEGVPAFAPAAIPAGFAERDLTPPIGQERPGGYGKSLHRQQLDPCNVRAAVFADGAETVALVGLDTLTIDRKVVPEVVPPQLG